MKKILIFLATLSFVACSNNHPIKNKVFEKTKPVEVVLQGDPTIGDDVTVDGDKILKEETITTEIPIYRKNISMDKTPGTKEGIGRVKEVKITKKSASPTMSAEVKEKIAENKPKELEDLVIKNSTTNYIVVEGDTLTKIGLKYKVPWSEIAEKNNINNSDVIRTGMILKIPKK